MDITDLEALNRLDDRANRETGMAGVVARADYLNRLHYCASNGRWDIANAHVWRLDWMYKGASGVYQDRDGLCGEHLWRHPFRVCHMMFKDERAYYSARRVGFNHAEAMDYQAGN